MNATCHCGTVSVTIAGRPDYINFCDCSLCRKMGGAWGYFQADQVEVVGQTEPDGRGRPTHIYMLTRTAQPDGLAALARALLDELSATRNPAQREARLGRVAEVLRADAGAEGGHLTQRLNAAVGRMTELNYHAHWEARAAGPQVILGNCPYAAIIEEHPELCHMDAAMLSAMTGVELTLAERFGRKVGDARVCRFLIKQQS